MTSTIALPALLDSAAVVALRAPLLRQVQALPAGVLAVLEVSGVQSFDSAGLALLLALRRAAQAGGVSVTVQGWTPRLQALAQTYGVLGLLDPSQAAGLDTPASVQPA